MHDALVRLFTERYGHPPRSVLEIAGDGSNRNYFRLVGNDFETAVGAYGPDPEENRAFISYTRAFRAGGLPVPELFGVDETARVWLEEDLGDTTLFNALVEARRARLPDAMPRLSVRSGCPLGAGRGAHISARRTRRQFHRQPLSGT
jgi:aminoglycoside/choline kinase family phosphotransferase